MFSDKTEAVTNTFAAGSLFDPKDDDDPAEPDIDADFFIFENEYTDNGDGTYTPTGNLTQTGNEYTVLPGVNIPKNATIGTNTDLAVDAYVFIEVNNTLKSPLSATVSSVWTKMKL